MNDRARFAKGWLYIWFIYHRPLSALFIGMTPCELLPTHMAPTLPSVSTPKPSITINTNAKTTIDVADCRKVTNPSRSRNRSSIKQ